MTGRRLVLALAALALLAGCASRVPAPARPAATPDTGLDRMERLTLKANACWFRSGDPAFRPYSLAPELSSFSGRPRFLLVPAGRYEARPLLVVEGRAGSTAVETYGPLTEQAVGRRIAVDIARWSAGGTGCAG